MSDLTWKYEWVKPESNCGIENNINHDTWHEKKKYKCVQQYLVFSKVCKVKTDKMHNNRATFKKSKQSKK